VIVITGRTCSQSSKLGTLAMASAAIPRFLLPQSSAMWQQARPALVRNATRTNTRYASSQSGKAKPIVLEKPAKFNPPSHGSRLPRKTPRHYGGELSEAEFAAQKLNDYPGMMAPEGTRAHWFWHSRSFHIVITMVRPLPQSTALATLLGEGECLPKTANTSYPHTRVPSLV